MAAIQEYTCPCCGGAIAFDSTVQKMKCPFCDTEFAVETLAGYANECKNDQADDMSWRMASKDEWEEEDAEGLNVYACHSCKGEVVGDENSPVTDCPFCGKPMVIMGKLKGALMPDLVIPFQVDKEAAKAALRKYYEGKRLLPKIFKDQNHIDEVKGIYVPFWLFDADANVDMRYKASKIRKWNDRKYDYTETKFYEVIRGGTLTFERVPVDGSSVMPDDLMESIGPFDFSKAVDFQPAYLAGYPADKFDADKKKSIERANERIKKSVEGAFRETVRGYTAVVKEAGSIRLQNGKAAYALLPVWLFCTTWNGRNFLFAMNGQTGRMAGDLPMDKTVYKRWLFGLTGGIGTVLFAVFYLLWQL